MDAKGYYNNSYYGTVAFSSTNYWMNGNNLLSPYNENDTIYYDSENYGFKYRSDESTAYPKLYDTNSNIYQYISGNGGYVDKLKEMGAPSTITGRLLTYEEADSAQSIEDNGTSIIFDGSQSYWLGSAYINNYVWSVISNYSDFDNDVYDNGGSLFGVRPVIEIPTSEIR